MAINAADIFPVLPGLQWGTTKSPRWKTETQTTASGRELDASYSSYPVWRFAISHAWLRNRAGRSEATQLQDFYNRFAGKGGRFYFQDPTDSAVARNAFAVGDGSTRVFRLSRPVSRWREPVQAVLGVPSIWQANVLKTAGTDYSVTDDGFVSFATAPANGDAIEWAGGFYHRCKWEKDDHQFKLDYQDIWSSNGLAFVSVKA